jgi:transposase InsO family protein
MKLRWAFGLTLQAGRPCFTPFLLTCPETQHGLTAPPGPAWERGLHRYLRSYNHERLHSALDYRTPWQYYQLRLAAGASSLT